MFRRAALAALVTAGCGRIGFTPLGDDAAGGDALASCGAIADMTDNFDAAAVSYTRWSTSSNGGVTVAQTAGTAQITLATGTGTRYGAFNGAQFYDLGTCMAAVTIVETPRVVSGAEAEFCLVQKTPNALLCFDIANGGLNSLYNPGTAMLYKNATFDAVADAHLRLRQNAGTVIWETSSDGSSWQFFDSQPSPIDLTQVTIALSAGTFMSVTSPGAARFDDLVVE
jgi:hypothetical protein